MRKVREWLVRVIAGDQPVIMNVQLIGMPLLRKEQGPPLMHGVLLTPPPEIFLHIDHYTMQTVYGDQFPEVAERLKGYFSQFEREDTTH